jgi:hypothetical protein
MNALIRAFAEDPTVRLVAVLVALDFVLGVAAAIAARTFRLGWLSDFLRRDVLAKLVPYFAVWAAVRLGGDVELGGIGVIEEAVGATVIAAVGASILNSLRDLCVMRGAPDEIAGSDVPPPAP